MKYLQLNPLTFQPKLVNHYGQYWGASYIFKSAKKEQNYMLIIIKAQALN